MGGFRAEPFIRKTPVSYPAVRSFWTAATRYAELTKSDSLIHKRLASAVNGLVDFLETERKRVPGDVLRDAERLECLLLKDMTRISWVTSLQGCDANQSCAILVFARTGCSFSIPALHSHVWEVNSRAIWRSSGMHRAMSATPQSGSRDDN
jgi:hypothetical protein